MTQNENTNDNKLRWQKISTDKESLEEKETALLQRIHQMCQASVDAIAVNNPEIEQKKLEELSILFSVIADVIFDFVSVASIDTAPYIIPVKALPPNRVAAYQYEFKQKIHSLLLNESQLLRCAHELFEGIMSDDDTEESPSFSQTAKLLYAILHELGHFRQMIKREKRLLATHVERTGDSDEEILAYLADENERNAHAVAIKFIQKKLADPQSTPLWKKFDFAPELGRNLENMFLSQTYSDTFKAQDLLNQRNNAIDIETQEEIQRKLMIMVKRLKPYKERLEKMHKKLGTIPPQETQ